MYFMFQEAMVFIMRFCMRKVTVSFIVSIPLSVCIRNAPNIRVTWNFIFGIFNEICTQNSICLKSDISCRHSRLRTIMICPHD